MINAHSTVVEKVHEALHSRKRKMENDGILCFFYRRNINLLSGEHLELNYSYKVCGEQPCFHLWYLLVTLHIKVNKLWKKTRNSLKGDHLRSS